MSEDFKPNWYPFWSPRFWHGMRTVDYFRLLRRNRFAIHPARVPLSLTVGTTSLFNSVLSATQRLFLNRQIERTQIEKPPIFIVGHWRTGTTMLHELLTCDPQFAFPSNYDCFVPHHFLVTKWFLSPLIGWLLPNRRPMDDMFVDAKSPQEDEFALCTMGASTPYLRLAFPNREPADMDLLNLDQASPDRVERFRRSLEFFFKSLTYHYGGRRLVLKSPPHTGRIRQLAKWFPGAKFIHLSRHPYQVFGSTLRLWRSLDQVQSFQLANYAEDKLERFVMDAHRRMYTGYYAQRDDILPEHLVELRFEDLVAAPEIEVQRIYERLSLGPFTPEVHRNIIDYQNQRRDYRPKSGGLDGPARERVLAEWSEYFEAFGYERVAPRTVEV